MRARALCALGSALAAAAPALALAGVRPAYGGEIVIALPAVPRTLDPALATDPSELLAARALHAPLVSLDPGGAPVPALLAEPPAPEPGALAWRLRLRPGLQFSDGSPLGAAEVAASLSRLAAAGAPHGWLVLAIRGAAEVAEGRAQTVRGIEVLSERELRIALDFPLPELPWALATLPAAIVSPRGAGAGPFRPAGGLAPSDARIALAANDLDPRGRPFPDRAVLTVAPARDLPGLLERGEVHLALRPEAVGRASVPLRPAVAVYAALNAARLAGGAGAIRRALAGVDRAELARRFVRGPSEPLAGLLPSWILPVAAAPRTAAAAPARAGSPRPIALLVPAGWPEARAAAERLQVKLFDAGIRASVEEVERARFSTLVSRGEHDVAIVPVALVATRPALAAAQVAWTIGGAGPARRALEELAGLEGSAAAAAADRLAARLDVVPLFASGLRASPGPALQGAAPGPDGGIEPGDAWLLRGAAPP